FFQAEDGIRDDLVTGVQTCALPISHTTRRASSRRCGSTRGRGAARLRDGIRGTRRGNHPGPRRGPTGGGGTSKSSANVAAGVVADRKSVVEGKGGGGGGGGDAEGRR